MGIKAHDPSHQLDSKFDELNDSIQSVKKDISALFHRMNNAKSRIGDLEGRSTSDKDVINEITKNVKYAQTRVIQLEWHSRRTNVVFLGLEERILELENQKQVVAVPGDRLPDMEKQHWTLYPRPDPSEPP